MAPFRRLGMPSSLDRTSRLVWITMHLAPGTAGVGALLLAVLTTHRVPVVLAHCITPPIHPSSHSPDCLGRRPPAPPPPATYVAMRMAYCARTWHLALQELGYCFLLSPSHTGSQLSSHQHRASQVVGPRVLLLLMRSTLASDTGAKIMPPALDIGTPATTWAAQEHHCAFCHVGFFVGGTSVHQWQPGTALHNLPCATAHSAPFRTELGIKRKSVTGR
jgi:hypothetical protein